MQLQDSKHNPKFYPKNGIKNQKFEIELLFKGSITRSEIKKSESHQVSTHGFQ